MKRALICLLLYVMSAPLIFAQTATIHVTFTNTASVKCGFAIPNKTLMRDYLKKGFAEVALDSDKTATYTVDLNGPEFMILYCDSSAARTGKLLSYSLYVSPGDNLDVKADFTQKDFGITVTGKGSNNNQPLRRSFFKTQFNQFGKDTLPNRLMTAINASHKILTNDFKDYIDRYKPSAAFIKAMQYNIDYYAAETFYTFKEDNKYTLGDSYYRNIAAWQNVTDSLFSSVKLNNTNALSSTFYRYLVKMFILRTKEGLWRQSHTDSVTFYKQWYNADVTTGEKEFAADQSNLLQEKIINKYFTGAVAEYLYATVFDGAFADANPANMIAIFSRFKQKFPNSEYTNWFSPLVNDLIIKDKNTLNGGMVFVASNGTNLNKLEDVLKLAKGKTVLLDMWGTWCGPCRSEMDKNSAAIKEYFKNKGVDYFYVANDDIGHEAIWKKLIAYFQLTGTHILANEKLSEDIMKKVKGTGYPTYVVIKKDGSYELSKAGYPMKRDMLIKQLEDALAVN